MFHGAALPFDLFVKREWGLDDCRRHWLSHPSPCTGKITTVEGTRSCPELLKSEPSLSPGVVSRHLRSVLGLNEPMSTVKSLCQNNRA